MRNTYEKCEILRSAFEHPALTTDVIVGFPQETEEEFEITRTFVDKVNFYETHIFKYSKRQGTKAAAMEDQIPEPVKADKKCGADPAWRKNTEKPLRAGMLEKRLQSLWKKRSKGERTEKY